MDRVTSLESMRRSAAITGAIARAPGGAVTLLDPRPLVHVRAAYGRAIAVTETHVLWEWVKAGEYHVRWDEKWQVRRVAEGEWSGEDFE
jgi:hypothetical protein